MLSVYIHIPFCDRKCGYCSFHVMALDELKEPSKVMNEYLDVLHKQIDQRGKEFKGEEIRTLYFGGGTPSSIGAENIIKIIDHIGQYWSFEYIEELSIEVNPYPVSVLQFIKTISQQYRKRPRVRFSIGVQSFNNEVLELANRQYGYLGLMDFLRDLAPMKDDNIQYNLDFIAFGKFNYTRKGNRVLRSEKMLESFAKIAQSGLFDGFSLYTLELFEGSEWYHKLSNLYTHNSEGLGLKKFGSDDDVYEEFAILKDILLEIGFDRYEISNFSKASCNSIHNRVYRNMGDYIGLGTSASSFVKQPQHIQKAQKVLGIDTIDPHTQALRRTTTKKLTEYIQAKYLDESSFSALSESELMTETVFLGLRTQEGVSQLSKYADVLESDRQKKLISREEQGFVTYENDRLRLTDSGMDIYNSVITELLKFEE